MIQYVKGDATNPLAKGPKLIVHVCNDIGKWGKGFVLALSKKWPAPERSYRDWYNRGENFKLGEAQFVMVTTDIMVVNMIAQAGVGHGSKGPPIRYDALRKCLVKVAKFIDFNDLKASVHMPRIGCGLAGGKWEKVEPIIEEALKELPVTVYDLP